MTDEEEPVMDAVDVVTELSKLLQHHPDLYKKIVLQVDGNSRDIVNVGYDKLTDSIVIDASE